MRRETRMVRSRYATLRKLPFPFAHYHVLPRRFPASYTTYRALDSRTLAHEPITSPCALRLHELLAFCRRLRFRRNFGARAHRSNGLHACGCWIRLASTFHASYVHCSLQDAQLLKVQDRRAFLPGPSFAIRGLACLYLFIICCFKGFSRHINTEILKLSGR